METIVGNYIILWFFLCTLSKLRFHSKIPSVEYVTEIFETFIPQRTIDHTFESKEPICVQINLLNYYLSDCPSHLNKTSKSAKIL